MPSAPDKNAHTPNPDSCNSLHPLTAFTRFIDDQISNVLQSTIGLPSSKEDIQTWEWWKDFEQNKHNNQSCSTRHEHGKSHQGTPEWVLSSPGPQNSPPRSPPQAQTMGSAFSDLSQALHYLQETSLPAIFEEMAPSTTETVPSVDVLRGNKEAYRDLKKYLDTSPYSPTMLEEDPKLENYPMLWRSAFMDLIAHAQEKDTPVYNYDREHMDEPDMGSYTWKYCVLDYVQKHDLHLRKQHESKMASSASHLLKSGRYTKSAQNGGPTQHTEQPDQSEQRTEQDFYDLWSQSQKKMQQSSAVYENNSATLPEGKRTVTEQMTLVQEVVLPDGTVQRKRVLRTGFSDGTATTQESNEVINTAKPTEANAESSSEEAGGPSEGKKGGWFWT